MEQGSNPRQDEEVSLKAYAPLSGLSGPSQDIPVKELKRALKQGINQLIPELESRLRWLLDARVDSEPADRAERNVSFSSDPRELIRVGKQDGLWAPCCGDASRILGFLLRREGFAVREHQIQGVLGDDWYLLAPFPYNRSPFNGHMLLVSEYSGCERIIIDPTYRQFVILRLERARSYGDSQCTELSADLPRADFEAPCMVVRESKIEKFVTRLCETMSELGDTYAIRGRNEHNQSMISKPLKRLWDLNNYTRTSPTPEEILHGIAPSGKDDPLLREALRR